MMVIADFKGQKMKKGPFWQRPLLCKTETKCLRVESHQETVNATGARQQLGAKGAGPLEGACHHWIAGGIHGNPVAVIAARAAESRGPTKTSRSGILGHINVVVLTRGGS